MGTRALGKSRSNSWHRSFCIDSLQRSLRFRFGLVCRLKGLLPFMLLPLLVEQMPPSARMQAGPSPGAAAAVMVLAESAPQAGATTSLSTCSAGFVTPSNYASCSKLLQTARANFEHPSLLVQGTAATSSGTGRTSLTKQHLLYKTQHEGTDSSYSSTNHISEYIYIGI